MVTNQNIKNNSYITLYTYILMNCCQHFVSAQLSNARAGSMNLVKDGPFLIILNSYFKGECNDCKQTMPILGV